MDMVLVDTIHDELSDIVHTGRGTSTVLGADIMAESLVAKDSHGLDEASNVVGSVS